MLNDILPRMSFVAAKLSLKRQGNDLKYLCETEVQKKNCFYNYTYI